MKHVNFLIALLVCALGSSQAQTTINTTVGSSGYNGSTSTSSNSFVTFVVANNSGGGIVLTDVGSYSSSSFNGVTATLWYSATSLSGSVGTLGSPNWTQVSSATISGITTTGVNPFITGMNFIIPNGATYRFALHVNTTSIRYSGGSPTPNNFTAGGVSLYTGNYQINSMNVGYVLTINPRYFTGFITFAPAGPPCPAPTNANAANITSNSADLSWSAVTGSVGYEYIVDQNATVTPPFTVTPTTATGFTKTGLTPSTTYYLHVRNKCSANNPSPWVHYPFTMLPPCKPPVGFNTTNLSPVSTTINWNAWPSALTYDYLVDQSRNDPASITGVKNISATSDNIPNLTENTWYYVHIRSKCVANEISDWSLDSFLTPIPCRAPVVKIEYIDSDEAVAYWDAVPTAEAYEYAITTSPTPPALGTRYVSTSVHTSSLYDGKDYYMHVRSQCNSLGIEGLSDWATASFKTFPVSVSNVSDDHFGLVLYPNPVQSEVTLTIDGVIDGNAVIAITDLAGREVRTLSASRKTLVINTSDLAAGTYLLKYTDDTKTAVSRMVKQ
jgi:hypothetical protein